MRLTVTAGAALVLAAAALLAACDPQDGSAPAANSARQSATPAAASNNPAGPAAPSAPAAPATPAASATPNDGIRRVSIADARAMAERGEAVIYDVRDQTAYETNHVKGSKLVPYMDVTTRAAEFPKDKLIITYCA